MTTKKKKTAVDLHDSVPPDWYFRSIKENPLQRYVHRRRFKEVSKVIEPVAGRVLDIGSADGVFSNVVLEKTHASEVIGIDVMKKSVDWANRHWKRNKRLKFRVGDAHRLEFDDGSFDALFALEVLEHVFEPKKVLGEAKRVLRKDGYAVFLVPAETLLFKFIWFFWTKYRGRVWREAHVHAYSNSYLVKLVRKAGFKVEADRKIIFGCLHLIKARK